MAEGRCGILCAAVSIGRREWILGNCNWVDATRPGLWQRDGTSPAYCSCVVLYGRQQLRL